MRSCVLLITNRRDGEKLVEKLANQEEQIEEAWSCAIRDLPRVTRAGRRPGVVLLEETAIAENALRQVVLYLRKLWPETRTMVVGDGDLDRMIGAARANADGYVPRRASAEEIAGMIDRAAEGEEFVLRYSVARARLEDTYREGFGEERCLALDGLTPREREVTLLVAEGMTNRELGKRLNISEETARWHVKNALRKLGLRDRTELAVQWHSTTEGRSEHRWENLASC